MSTKVRNIKTQTEETHEISVTNLLWIQSQIFADRSSQTILHDKQSARGTHCHSLQPVGVCPESRNKLVTLSVACLILTIVEIVGGIWSNSLAVAADAMRLCVLFASLMINLFTMWLSNRAATQRFNFGLYRAEVIAALLAVLVIWFALGAISLLAFKRVVGAQFEVKTEIMLVISVVAMTMHFLIRFQLHLGREGWVCSTKTRIVPQPYRPRLVVLSEEKHIVCASGERFVCSFRHQGTQTDRPTCTSVDHRRGLTSLTANEDLTMKWILIHSVRDVMQSILVFVTGLVIYFQPKWKILDPVLALLCSVVVFIGTLSIIRDSLMVLMESTPTYLDYNEILNILLSIPGVTNVHSLRIWALDLRRIACLAHLKIEEGANHLLILQMASKAIHERYSFYETTIQVE